MWLRSVGSFSDPHNFSKLLISRFVVVVAVCMPGQGRKEVEPSAGELSEAKTQRRPHSAERKSDIVRRGFSFVVFVYFFEQGKKTTKEAWR